MIYNVPVLFVLNRLEHMVYAVLINDCSAPVLHLIAEK